MPTSESTLDIHKLWTAAFEEYSQSVDADLQGQSISFLNKLEECRTGEDIFQLLQNTSHYLDEKRRGSKAPRVLREKVRSVVDGLSVILDAGAEVGSSMVCPALDVHDVT